MATTTKSLGLFELVAICLGGMIGGGIFSILGVAVEQVGNAAPIAIGLGAALALCAAFSYARLAAYYEDEGATYSFFKKTFPGAPGAAAIIGWLVVFGYISTLALYAFTFASYVGSMYEPHRGLHGALSAGVLLVFSVLNIVSVKGMGKVEDLLVYTKIVAMLVVTGVLYATGSADNAMHFGTFQPGSILLVAALTFVAFEGFQLAIHAYEEVDNPKKNVPRAIYLSIVLAAGLYIAMAEGALWALDKEQIIADKEFALAAGAAVVLGRGGYWLMLAAAIMATSSAISGTLFGASRLAAVISTDKFLPGFLSKRNASGVPANAIIALAVTAWLLVLSGRLELIIEFGSLTFICVSLLMAISNFRVRKHTGTSVPAALVAIVSLAGAGACIVGWQAFEEPAHLAVTVGVAVALGGGALWFAARKVRQQACT
jgi:amino acid transporter